MLELEGLIVDRLREALPDGVRVMSASDLAGMQSALQVAPAVHVIYQNYKVLESHANGLIAFIEQTWLTVAVIRNVRDQKSGAAARAGSSDIASTIYKALAGWIPEGVCLPLQLVNAPNAGFEAGAFYLPMAWKTQIQLTNEIDENWPRLRRVTADYGGFGTEEIPDGNV